MSYEDDCRRTLHNSSEFVVGMCKEADATIATLQARIAELEAAQRWRPIETAPKDGGVVLVLAGDPALAWWDRGEWYDPSIAEDILPTHWTPLPPPLSDERETE